VTKKHRRFEPERPKSPRQLGCPIPGTHNRLREAHRLWHQAADQYADPAGFQPNLNATIQALRNVTWVLQKEHAAVPDFEPWYVG
jgi:hypothetical protein